MFPDHGAEAGYGLGRGCPCDRARRHRGDGRAGVVALRERPRSGPRRRSPRRCGRRFRRGSGRIRGNRRGNSAPLRSRRRRRVRPGPRQRGRTRQRGIPDHCAVALRLSPHACPAGRLSSRASRGACEAALRARRPERGRRRRIGGSSLRRRTGAPAPGKGARSHPDCARPLFADQSGFDRGEPRRQVCILGRQRRRRFRMVGLRKDSAVDAHPFPRRRTGSRAGRDHGRAGPSDEDRAQRSASVIAFRRDKDR